MIRRVAAFPMFAASIAATFIVGRAQEPVRAAQTWQVSSTDDAYAAGTCPSTNYSGYPTGGNCFVPDVLTIGVGDTVTWSTTGKRPHDTTSEDGSFDSGRMEVGSQYSHTFDVAGEFPYFCSLHGDRGGVGHAGKIIVSSEPPPDSEPSTGASAGTQPGSGAGTTGSATGSTGSSGEVGSVPVFIATEMSVRISEVAAPASDGSADEGSSNGGMIAGVFAGLALLVAWRLATGGRSSA